MPATTATARTRLLAAARSALKAHEMMVSRDWDGKPVIAGARGWLEIRGDKLVAVTDRLWVLPALEQVSGVTRTGSRCEYFTFSVPRTALAQVAQLLGCYTTRRERA